MPFIRLTRQILVNLLNVNIGSVCTLLTKERLPNNSHGYQQYMYPMLKLAALSSN